MMDEKTNYEIQVIHNKNEYDKDNNKITTIIKKCNDLFLVFSEIIMCDRSVCLEYEKRWSVLIDGVIIYKFSGYECTNSGGFCYRGVISAFLINDYGIETEEFDEETNKVKKCYYNFK